MSHLPELRKSLVKAAERQATPRAVAARVRRRRPSIGALATALAVLVTVAVAAVGLSLGGHGGNPATTGRAGAHKHVAPRICAAKVTAVPRLKNGKLATPTTIKLVPPPVTVLTRAGGNMAVFMFRKAPGKAIEFEIYGPLPAARTAVRVYRQLVPIRLKQSLSRCRAISSPVVAALLGRGPASNVKAARVVAPPALIAAHLLAGKTPPRLCLAVSTTLNRCFPNAYVLVFDGDKVRGTAPDGIAQVKLSYKNRTVTESITANTFAATVPRGVGGIPLRATWLTAGGKVKRSVKLGR